MTTPAAAPTKRRPPRAPVPTPAPEPQWPAVDAAAATLRAMPEVAYLFTEKVPPTKEPIVITRDMDRGLHEASAAADLLPEAHGQWLEEQFAEAYERVHAPLRAFCKPRHARPTDATEGPEGPSVEQDEPEDAA